MRHHHAVALVLGALLVLPATAGAVTAVTPVGAKPYFDSRAADRGRVRASATVAAARPDERTRLARADLRRNLGRGAVLNVDPLTGTPRQLLRTDGALADPRGGDRADIALEFARANREALGLDSADLDGLDLRRRLKTAQGLTVVQFRQLYRGIPAFDNDLRVAIDRAGRVVSVAGAPRHDLAVASVQPSLSGAEALVRLQRNVGVERSLPVRSGPVGVRRTTTFEGGDFARLVLFGTADGAKLAWHVTYRATSMALYDAVVDATSGTILYRQNLTKADTNADVYPNHPGASATARVNLEDFGLPAGSTKLDGEFSRQWADLDDGNDIDPAEETTPSAGTDFVYPFTAYTPTAACTTTEPCAWDTTTATTRGATRTTNQLQNGVQAFYLVSSFHDHLAGGPVGFTAASGNFEKAGGDAVDTQTDDGAATGPDADHRNNANMSTPPDGSPPTMQMYLFRDTGSPTALDFRSMNGGDDSGVVWHEYTHGLSNRLVTNADGSGAVSSAQSGAMGEGWSDWYASDWQERLGFKSDTVAPGEIDVGDYSDADLHKLRSQALDCPVGPATAPCPGAPDTAGGGYTYGDFGKVAGTPEVHADGEIWAETLWDLRRAMPGTTAEASDLAEQLVTDGMRLSPPEPTMLDMRNAILAADQAAGGVHHDLIWQVFSHRGMGFFAAAADGADTQPAEDFTPPPATGGPQGAVTGVVTDAATGLPIAGVHVGFGGAPGFADDTDGSGRYAIANLPAGSYPKLAAVPSGGYNSAVARDIAITGNATTTRNFGLDRDWAALGAGAAVTQFSENSSAPFGCGVADVFDQSQTTGWSAWNPDSTDPTSEANGPPTVTIRLPKTVNVTGFLIDPTPVCGDDGSAAAGEYRVETATGTGSFRTAVDGTGAGGFASGDVNRLNRRNPSGGTGQNTDLVRITLLSPQSTSGAGADFIDLTEFEVLGAVPNTLPTGSLAVSNANPRAGDVITFDASAFTDADSAITGYDWDFDHDGTVDRTTVMPTTAFAYGTTGSYLATVAAKDFRGGAGNASTGVTVTAAPSGSPAPPVPPGTPPALGPVPSLTLPARGTRGSIRPSVKCALLCSVRAKLVVSRATARKLRLKRRTLARLTRTLTTTKRARLRLRVPAKVRASLRKRGVKSILATLTITAIHLGGRANTADRLVRIRM
jgi:extracellular elastinolytic metalloproteinase